MKGCKGQNFYNFFGILAMMHAKSTLTTINFLPWRKETSQKIVWHNKFRTDLLSKILI